ncbi:MAG TPA: TetR/AcrR family transcriptional regulator, partial [Actinomycetales bacterium]|nr:TetR/AcrR family transcriptional regulator [Actinomycetales bacterium]
AGLQPRYFYEHFAGREALVEAVADEVRAELFDALVTSALGEGGDLEARLRAALTAFFGMIAADPSIHAIMRTDLAVIPGLERRRVESLDMVAELILRHGATDPGQVPVAGVAPRRVARFAAGGVNHLLESWLEHPEGTPGELAEQCTRLCLRLVESGGGQTPTV